MERINGSIKRIKRKLRDSGFAKKLVTALVVVSTTLSPLSPVFATAAQAAETPETATVTLMETEHGTLTFDGTDDRAITVDVGSEVTVNATPDDGYFADSLAVFTSETEATAVDLTDGKATFTVNGDVSVTCAFNENGTAGSDALKPVTVDEQSTNTSVEQYIRDHADSQYVGEGDDLTRKDLLTVTTTVVDGSKLPDATLESLWETDEDGDGMSDNWDAMLSNAVSHAVLFEVDPDSDYYVGWAGAGIEGAKLTDWAAVENNADAVARDGFIVDEATGLVYVPKSYTELNDEGEPMVESSRIQLVYTVEDASAEATFDFTTNMTDVSGNVPSEGKVSVPVVTTNTRVTIAPDDETRESVRTQTVDSVTVNGIEYTPDMDMWTYDAESGVLTFNMAPTGIHALTVNMSNNVGKDFVAFFGLTAQQRAVTRAAGANNIGTWQFECTPWNGLLYNVSAHNTYRAAPVSGYTYPAVENPTMGDWESKTAQQALGWNSVDLSALHSGNYSIERTSSIRSQTVDAIAVDGIAMTIPSTANLNLTCCHAEIGPDFTYVPGYNEGDALEDDLGARVRIAAVYGSTAIIGVTIPTSHTQAGAGFFEINWEVSEGGIGIIKSSANPSITDGNDTYALNGAVYGVYSDSGCTQLVTTLSTDAEGRSDYWGLRPGTYYLKEITAPEGFYVDTETHTATVNGGSWTRINVADMPAMDPVAMLVGKYDGQRTYNGEANLPQGSASLAGAEFTVEYYDTLDYDNYDALKDAGISPTRSWVFATDADGFAYFDTEHLVSGSALYLNSDNQPSLPRGTVVIRETKAPTGYNLNSDFVSFQKIDENWSEDAVTYNTPQVPETVKTGGVEVYKRDAEVVASYPDEPDGPLGAATLAGAEFEIVTLNDNPVKVDGVLYTKGEVVKTIVTDDTGYASTAADTLPYGSYTIQEVKANEGYNLTDNTAYEFFVDTDGEIQNPVDDSYVENLVKRSDMEFSKKADDSGDRLAGIPFKVTSQTTGESHIVVTDENGYVSTASSWNAHTQNTNGNDWALEVGDDEVIDSSQLDPTAGVWFGLARNGKIVAADDSLGALPYDSYTIEELRCTNNENYQLVSTSINITRNGVSYDFGTIDDVPESPVTITTRAYDPTDGDSSIAVGNVLVGDKVSYSGLTVGNTYRLSATVVDAATGEAITSDGETVTASKSFTAEATTGYVTMEFSIPTYELGGRTVTVCEELYLVRGSSETRVADHMDKDDIDQQLRVVAPRIGTTAVDGVDGDKNVVTDEATTIVDTVAYQNLIPGTEYTVMGTLYVKGTDDEGNVTEEALEVDGKPVTAETTFTPESPDGTVEVTFTFDARYLDEGTQLVAFESLSRNEVELATHADINDAGQTVTIDKPEIGTTAADGVDGDQYVVADGNSTVVDTVAYTGLVPGKEYTVSGTLHVKKTDDEGNVTEEALEVDGKPVTAETTFTPESPDGTVEVTFTFDSAAIPDGTQLVAFESLDRVGVELAAHADINDEAQTVTVRETNIGTIASDGLDGDKSVIADAETTITDDVAYNSALTGNEYTMAGVLMDKATGLPILTGDGSEKYSDDDVKGFMEELFNVLGVDAEGGTTVDVDALDKLLSDNADLVSHMVFASTEFAPETSSGSVSMDFNFNANDIIDRLNGETKDVVVYEMMFKGSFDDEDGNAPVIVATELDLENGDQTVTVIPTVIGTTATDASDGDHELMAGKDATITDTVTYEGLIPGKEYTLRATLYDKATGEPLSVNDQHVTAELKFTPNSQSGSVDIVLGPFDASELDGHTLVVFEELYKQSLVDGEATDILVAEHKDINDEDQSVTVTSSPAGSTIDKTTPGGTYGKTGGSNASLVAAMVLLLAAALGFTVYGLRKRHAANAEADVEDTLPKPTDGSDD